MVHKQAFLIILYRKSNSLKDLLSVLSNTGGDVFIHIDRKSKDESLISLINTFQNAKIIKEHFDVSWGGFNMVRAMLSLMREAYNSKEKYTHYVFLSGSDYPVLGGDKINEFFSKYETKELINAYQITNNGCLHCKSKVTKYFYMDNIIFNKKVLSKMYNFIASELFRGKKKKDYFMINTKRINIFYGSQWFALTENCVKYVLNQANNQNYIEYFEHAMAPDEMFFHTIIFNSPFYKNNLYNGPQKYNSEWNLFNYTYLDSTMLSCEGKLESSKLRSKIQSLKKRKTYKEKYKRVGNGSINFLDEEYYSSIVKSGLPFCRKIDDLISRKLILKLKKNLNDNN